MLMLEYEVKLVTNSEGQTFIIRVHFETNAIINQSKSHPLKRRETKNTFRETEQK